MLCNLKRMIVLVRSVFKKNTPKSLLMAHNALNQEQFYVGKLWQGMFVHMYLKCPVSSSLSVSWAQWLLLGYTLKLFWELNTDGFTRKHIGGMGNCCSVLSGTNLECHVCPCTVFERSYRDNPRLTLSIIHCTYKKTLRVYTQILAVAQDRHSVSTYCNSQRFPFSVCV